VDLYRLESARDAATLGLDELFDSPALVIVEWGERFPELMPRDRIEIRLRALGDDQREIDVRGGGL
jgi:tRNA threonylcarbamoyladenosine biosynthesis protein TsaE